METIEIVNRITTAVCAAVLGIATFYWVQGIKKAKEEARAAQARARKKQKKARKRGRRAEEPVEAPLEATPLTVKEKRIEWGIFAALMLAAFLLRVWQFGSVPGGMNQDGAMAAVDAKALADHATDRYGMFMPVHFTAWGYGQMSVLL